MSKLTYKASYYALYAMFAIILIVWVFSSSEETLQATQSLRE